MPEHAECLLIEFGFQGTAIAGPLVAQDLESRPLHLFEWSVNLRKSVNLSYKSDDTSEYPVNLMLTLGPLSFTPLLPLLFKHRGRGMRVRGSHKHDQVLPDLVHRGPMREVTSGGSEPWRAWHKHLRAPPWKCEAAASVRARGLARRGGCSYTARIPVRRVAGRG